jgi:hypothetical protein
MVCDDSSSATGVGSDATVDADVLATAAAVGVAEAGSDDVGLVGVAVVVALGAALFDADVVGRPV